MRFVQNYARILPYSPTMPLIHIERCGRTCYNSLDKMGKDTARPFVQSLINRHHYAMLEHANFVFCVNATLYHKLQKMNEVCAAENEREYPSWGAKHLSFTKVNVLGHYDRYLVSGNVRAINNVHCYEMTQELKRIHPELVYNDTFDAPDILLPCTHIPDIFELDDLHEEEIRAHYYLTFLCETDRGVTHEMVRHREASYAQESTRYCNYSKGEYDGEITFVLPSTYNEWSRIAQNYYKQYIETAEAGYNLLASCGLSAQQARAVLPNSTKATIIMTTNVDEYIHFFNLRYKGITGAPHPDMKDLAGKMYDEYTWFFDMKGIRQFDNILL